MSLNFIVLEFSLSIVEAIFQPISPIFKPIILNYAHAKKGLPIIPKSYARPSPNKDTQCIFHIVLSILTGTITVTILVGLWCDLLGGV